MKKIGFPAILEHRETDDEEEYPQGKPVISEFWKVEAEYRYCGECPLEGFFENVEEYVRRR